jgi:hypothetical protein
MTSFKFLPTYHHDQVILCYMILTVESLSLRICQLTIKVFVLICIYEILEESVILSNQVTVSFSSCIFSRHCLNSLIHHAELRALDKLSQNVTDPSGRGLRRGP